MKEREHPELKDAQNTLLDGNHPLIAGLDFLMVASICLGFLPIFPISVDSLGFIYPYVYSLKILRGNLSPSQALFC